MSDHVVVSYIMSTRNRADFLPQAFANIREFITADDELLVIDGASSDHTPAVVDANHDIVRLFISEPDRGEAHGFNKGLLAARGRYIKLLSDDDYIYPDAMRQAIELLTKHPEIDALLCGGEFYNHDAQTGDNNFAGFMYLAPGKRLAEDLRNVFYQTTCGLGLVLTRKVLARAGLLDTTFRAVDTDYMARLIACQTDFRFAEIKLFRHILFPHSGQQNTLVMDRDRVRSLLHAGRWDIIGGFNPPETSLALGLSKLRYGDALARLILYGEKLRHSRLGFLIPALARSVDAAYRIARPWIGGPTPAPGRRVPESEINWDGSLR